MPIQRPRRRRPPAMTTGEGDTSMPQSLPIFPYRAPGLAHFPGRGPGRAGPAPSRAAGDQGHGFAHRSGSCQEILR